MYNKSKLILIENLRLCPCLKYMDVINLCFDHCFPDREAVPLLNNYGLQQDSSNFEHLFHARLYSKCLVIQDKNNTLGFIELSLVEAHKPLEYNRTVAIAEVQTQNVNAEGPKSTLRPKGHKEQRRQPPN